MINKLSKIMLGFVAIEHIAIMLLEMFYWDHPIGRKIFNMSEEVSAASATLAANQGLYNGFLAAGLLWSLFSDRRELKVFFLSCVVLAGVFGAITAKPSIVLTQAAPALFALILCLLAHNKAKEIE